jgi:hypothetical protein
LHFCPASQGCKYTGTVYIRWRNLTFEYQETVRSCWNQSTACALMCIQHRADICTGISQGRIALCLNLNAHGTSLQYISLKISGWVLTLLPWVEGAERAMQQMTVAASALCTLHFAVRMQVQRMSLSMDGCEQHVAFERDLFEKHLTSRMGRTLLTAPEATSTQALLVANRHILPHGALQSRKTAYVNQRREPSNASHPDAAHAVSACEWFVTFLLDSVAGRRAGATCVVDLQSAGKGRGGSTWTSPLGCLMASTYFATQMPGALRLLEPASACMRDRHMLSLGAKT